MHWGPSLPPAAWPPACSAGGGDGLPWTLGQAGRQWQQQGQAAGAGAGCPVQLQFRAGMGLVPVCKSFQPVPAVLSRRWATALRLRILLGNSLAWPWPAPRGCQSHLWAVPLPATSWQCAGRCQKPSAVDPGEEDGASHPCVSPTAAMLCLLLWPPLAALRPREVPPVPGEQSTGCHQVPAEASRVGGHQGKVTVKR